MGLFELFRRPRKPDLDDSVLNQLRKAGSDLSKPHEIEFFLYFPTEAIAEQAASHIREAGFDVNVKQAAKGNDWLCFATKKMVPELAALQKIRMDFSSLSNSLGGEYDGWGTPVVN
jgi:regulator of RNase E activity RraB